MPREGPWPHAAASVSSWGPSHGICQHMQAAASVKQAWSRPRAQAHAFPLRLSMHARMHKRHTQPSIHPQPHTGFNSTWQLPTYLQMDLKAPAAAAGLGDDELHGGAHGARWREEHRVHERLPSCCQPAGQPCARRAALCWRRKLHMSHKIRAPVHPQNGRQTFVHGDNVVLPIPLSPPPF